MFGIRVKAWGASVAGASGSPVSACGCHYVLEDGLAHRRGLAQSWVEEIRETCQTLSKEALPKSALGKALAYTLKQREPQQSKGRLDDLCED